MRARHRLRFGLIVAGLFGLIEAIELRHQLRLLPAYHASATDPLIDQLLLITKHSPLLSGGMAIVGLLIVLAIIYGLDASLREPDPGPRPRSTR